MKRLLLSLFGVALLAVGGLTTTASAGTIMNPVFSQPSPEIPAQFTGGEYSVGREFTDYTVYSDTVSFSITSATQLVLKVLTFGRIDLTFTLQNGGNNATILSTSFGTGTLRGETGILVTELLSLTTAGGWLLTVSGDACHCAGYVIDLAGDPAVTPLPAALVMFLTALVGLGGFGWLRRASGATMAAAA